MVDSLPQSVTILLALLILTTPLSIRAQEEEDHIGLSPNDEIGLVQSAAIDSHGQVVVLDGMSKELLVFGRGRRLLGRVGGSGRGPGEFVSPQTMSLDHEGVVHVLDQGTGRISRFSVDPGAPRFLSSVSLGLGAYDFCLVPDETWVLGSSEEGTILHRIDEAGQITRSIGFHHLHEEQPGIAGATMNGLLRCSAIGAEEAGESMVLVLASVLHGVVRAFSPVSGQEVWSFSIPDFVPVDIEVVDAGVRFSRGAGEFYHRIITLGVLDEDRVWVQYGRLDGDVRQPEEVTNVETFLLSLHDGSIIGTPDWPRVDHVRGTTALSIRNGFIPHVRLLELDELE